MQNVFVFLTPSDKRAIWNYLYEKIRIISEFLLLELLMCFHSFPALVVLCDLPACDAIIRAVLPSLSW